MRESQLVSLDKQAVLENTATNISEYLYVRRESQHGV